MNVSTLCLAILSFADASGYDIRKATTEGNFSHFVDASYGSIYPALDRLENEDLVTRRVEVQGGRPTRHVYQITEAGRAALVSQLMEPLAADKVRSEFLLLALCAEHLPSERLQQVIDTRIDEFRGLADDFAEKREACEHPASRWVLDLAVLMNRTKQVYLSENRDALIALGKPRRSAAAE